MIAAVTSIGEATTDLCVWSLERQGFEVRLYKSSSSLWEKLKQIYSDIDEDFLRVDADVICNGNVLQLVMLNEAWWYQARIWEWFRMDLGHGGIQFIRKQCLPALREHIAGAEHLERPESYMSRLAEFHNPRRFESSDIICGIHGYGQSDIKRIRETKERRGQHGDYDWDLAARIEAL